MDNRDDKRLERIEIKIDDLGEHLGDIDKTLAAQHEQLRYHIKRTNLLEEELKPVKRHVDMVNGGLKLLGILSLIAGLIEAFRAFGG